MKRPLKYCCNGCKDADGKPKPTKRPSWVLCADCLAGLDQKMHALLPGTPDKDGDRG
jgi:hypothetical protein